MSNKSNRRILLCIVTVALYLFDLAPVLAQDSTSVDSSHAQNPGRALLFSFIPGGGQLYNKRPIKALLFAGVFAYYGYEYLGAQKDFEANNSDSKLHRVRNDKIWMMTLTWSLNLIDAYVDAQFWDFDQYPIDEAVIPKSESIKPKEMEEINGKD